MDLQSSAPKSLGHRWGIGLLAIWISTWLLSFTYGIGNSLIGWLVETPESLKASHASLTAPKIAACVLLGPFVLYLLAQARIPTLRRVFAWTGFAWIEGFKILVLCVVLALPCFLVWEMFELFAPDSPGAQGRWIFLLLRGLVLCLMPFVVFSLLQFLPRTVFGKIRWFSSRQGAVATFRNGSDPRFDG